MSQQPSHPPTAERTTAAPPKLQPPKPQPAAATGRKGGNRTPTAPTPTKTTTKAAKGEAGDGADKATKLKDEKEKAVEGSGIVATTVGTGKDFTTTADVSLLDLTTQDTSTTGRKAGNGTTDLLGDLSSPLASLTSLTSPKGSAFASVFGDASALFDPKKIV